MPGQGDQLEGERGAAARDAGPTPALDVARWKILSQLLDQLLEMEAPQRQSRLEHLRAGDPELAQSLERLLANEHEMDDFLAEPCWSPPATTSRAGSQVGPYRLLQLLGEGGMGEVWLAERADGLYQRRVALKLLRAGYADPRLRQRFSQEREILARLEHPNLSRLLDAGVGEEGQPYLALTYVEGEPITEYCQRLQLPVEARLRLIVQVCAAVSHAHRNLVVHRDLKPSNILVTAAGEVCLLDFGIAKLLDGEADATPEIRAFTLHYAAPEQVRGEPITTLTDVYSLGVVLYEVLTDQKPYRLRRQSDAEWETAILGVEPPRPSLAVKCAAQAGRRDRREAQRLARRLRGDLDSILIKALQKQPAHRYASAEALGQDLQCHLEDRPVQARPARTWYRLHKYLRRHRWAAGIGGVALVALLAASATVVWQARQARIEMVRAQALQGFVIALFEVAGKTPRGDFDIRRLLDAGERRGQDELAQQPMAQAELYGVIARLRIGLGDYRQALRLLERQQRLLAGQPQVSKGLQLEAATQHGRALRMLGQSGRCIRLLEPLAATATQQQGVLPQHAANFYSQLGRCERVGGSPAKARRWLQRALALRRDNGDSIGVIENMADLAALDGDAGHNNAAIAGYRKALALLRGKTGSEHPLEVTLQRGLAAAYRDLGDVTQAEREARAALAQAEQVHGTRHPETLAARRLLAAVLIDRGQLLQAGQELRQAHALTVQTLGPEHRETGSSWNALGTLALEQGNLELAVANIARSVQVWRQPDSVRLLPYGLANYGRVLILAGRHDDALGALREARRLRVAQLGEDDGAVADVDRQIAEVLGAQGQVQAADALLASAIARAQRHYGDGHPRLRMMRLAQARNLGRMGHEREALQQLERLAKAGAGDGERRRLHWLARSYVAELRCRDAPGPARRELRTVHDEVRRAMPEGGTLVREVDAVQARCDAGTRLATR